jgi:hypothetical protein
MGQTCELTYMGVLKMAINLAYLWLVAPKASDRLKSIGLHHSKLFKPTRDRRARMHTPIYIIGNLLAAVSYIGLRGPTDRLTAKTPDINRTAR